VIRRLELSLAPPLHLLSLCPRLLGPPPKMASVVARLVSLALVSLALTDFLSVALRLDGVVIRRLTAERAATLCLESAVFSRLSPLLPPRALHLPPLCPLFLWRPRLEEIVVLLLARLARVSYSTVSRQSAAPSTTTVVTQKRTVELVATHSMATVDLLVPALARVCPRLRLLAHQLR
jgi:hypothetical protein